MASGQQEQQQQLQEPEALDTPPDFSSLWESGHTDERLLRHIPSYVYDYTPYVHLFSGEDFWPCDISDHLLHTTPHLNYTPIANMTHRTLDNLDELNQFTRFTYLQSNDNVEERPTWLGGSSNIPNSPGRSDGKDEFTGPLPLPESSAVPDLDGKGWHEVGVGDIRAHGGIRPNPSHPTSAPTMHTDHGKETTSNPHERKAGQGGGRSSAPAVLVVVPKEHGVVDAFWFYFYSFNQGNQVLNVRFGDHVGDWEHSVVRFQHGVPKAVFLSEHNFGEAYSYGAVEKIGRRPVIYSAVGTHANYATPGLHPYVLPWGLLHDETDRGPLWDPLKNHHAYVYNYTSGHLRSSTQTPDAPVSWFNFRGRWGDKFYPMSDSRQYKFAGQYHYVSGPLGPKFKNLGRKTVCQGNDKCVIKHWLGGGRIKSWPGKSDDPEQDLTDSQPESTK